MELAGSTLTKIDSTTCIKPFDCGDKDLNTFLHFKAKWYEKEHLAITYILENAERTIAFFSIFNDSMQVDESALPSKSALKRLLSKLVTHPKRHLKCFPAMKIGRLAVDITNKEGGIGTVAIRFIISVAVELNNTCACKLLTVDAYKQSLGFYEKLGFCFFSESDTGRDTRQMYLDLSPIINASNAERMGW